MKKLIDLLTVGKMGNREIFSTYQPAQKSQTITFERLTAFGKTTVIHSLQLIIR